ncbi:MAG: enoyl-CoA hydratase/isomerase family protein [Alcaligenaceae bacterium]
MLKINLENNVLTLSFDRASAANALNAEIYGVMHQALVNAATQDAVKVVVITGEGARAFCSGADLKEFSDLKPVEAAHQRLHLLMRCFLELIDFPKPVIAAVQAPAVGAGLMLAALCDEVLIAEHTWVSLPEVKFDMPTPIGAAIVSARSNRSVCHRLVQLGDRISATQCVESGLVDQAVPLADLSALCAQRASALAQIPSYGFAVNKKWMNRDVRQQLLAASEVAEAAHHRG